MTLHDAGQHLLFPRTDLVPRPCGRTSSTFADNAKLPVHRWFHYSAGFSGAWAESIIADAAYNGPTRVFDPFAGSGTTLLAAENIGVESFGLDAHPFICRVARAKLAHRSDPETYRKLIDRIICDAKQRDPNIDHYPVLIRRCYDDPALQALDLLRQAVDSVADGSPAAELAWLTLVGILRRVSHAGTAQWQYVLPSKTKKRPLKPVLAFHALSRTIYNDMVLSNELIGPHARFIEGDARSCRGVPEGFATLVITSPPYPNNYDYADATRLEMSFLGEIASWRELHESVRKYLLRSCTQHVPENTVNLDSVLSRNELGPIQSELTRVCQELAEVRLTKGGKKTYHLMVSCYFLDLAQAWFALRRVCASRCKICFVIGDSAPYGVYVPVIDWLSQLALAAGFKGCRFERTRDRNVKWKNRKHRVPLCEGHLWVDG